MREYKELVETLRSEADGFLMADVPDMLMVDTLNDAADAIEELQQEVSDLRSYVKALEMDKEYWESEARASRPWRMS